MISAENWAGVSLFTAECSAQLGHQPCDGRSECSYKGSALGPWGPGAPDSYSSETLTSNPGEANCTWFSQSDI